MKSKQNKNKFKIIQEIIDDFNSIIVTAYWLEPEDNISHVPQLCIYEELWFIEMNNNKNSKRYTFNKWWTILHIIFDIQNYILNDMIDWDDSTKEIINWEIPRIINKYKDRLLD